MRTGSELAGFEEPEGQRGRRALSDRGGASVAAERAGGA